MKLVREHINEKFIEDSDPIDDMEIGLKYLINQWLQEMKFKYKYSDHNKFTINADFTINVDAGMGYTFALLEDEYKELPDYIRFNIVDGNFACSFKKQDLHKYLPKVVTGNFSLVDQTDITRDLIKKYCKIGGKLYIN